MNITKNDLFELGLSPEQQHVFNNIFDRLELLESKGKRNVFKAPDRKMVFEYMCEKGCFDPASESEKFVNYYASNGWMVGRTKMKDWHATVRTWLGRLKQQQPSLAIDAPKTQKQAVRESLRDVGDTSW